MAENAGTTLSFELTDDELEQFHRDGFYGPFDLYEPGEMERALQAMRPQLIDSQHSVYHQGEALSGTTNLASYDRHLDIDFLARHITRPELVDRVTSVLGPSVLCWRSEFFPKYPG